MRSFKLAIVALAATGLAACESDGAQTRPADTIAPAPAPAPSRTPATGNTTGSSGSTTGTPAPRPAGSVPTLINVNLQNVLNNLSVSLSVDRNSVPVTAQVPIDVAAAVCGVSVDALAASVASGRGTCTATTTTPALNQVVQQQISTGGNVQGGDQNLNTGT